ncbi:MAG TPA: acetylxylan esterase [Flavitalea sp.]|nr:acetylxylan esterase [Flavitalea sp.]
MKAKGLLAASALFVSTLNAFSGDRAADRPQGADRSLSENNVLSAHIPTIFDLNKGKDSLPSVFPQGYADLVRRNLEKEAAMQFARHQLPNNLKDWQRYKLELRKQIIKKSGVIIDPQLPLNLKETGSLKKKGYTVKKVSFQTRPGIHATGNLFVPDGEGPFPAVIIMHGHWKGGHTHEIFQSAASSFALNGYVSLTIDAFGGGERTTVHGVDEYHGSNLGASCMNIGESLMGIQISDNMRGVDLLSSLPYVDASRIGATGASGGGNQTMWLTAIDERIKAAVPVVSVGTFETYIMKDNCICELLVDGLTLSEESAILAMVAPRAIKMCNHNQDAIPTFLPAEMLRSYRNALPVFKMYGVEDNISYQLFDLPHTYNDQDREAVLGWFDLHLKGVGTGAPKKETPFELIPEEQLMVFPEGKRDANVIGVAQYCKDRGTELRKDLLKQTSFNASVKKKELRDILRVNNVPAVKQAHRYSREGGWDRIALETSDGKLIPVLVQKPSSPAAGYTIVSHPRGKHHIPAGVIEELRKSGSGIVTVDLIGTGEASSKRGNLMDDDVSFHTISRAELWLGKSLMGEWIKELHAVISFLGAEYKAQKIQLDGYAEAGLASLFLAATTGSPNTATGAGVNIPVIGRVTLRDAPASYLFDQRETVNHFTMAIHLPGFLNWGDVSLAAALSGKNINFINPLTMSGRAIDGDGLAAYQAEYEKLKRTCKTQGKTVFQ